jgi:hypothetical protein
MNREMTPRALSVGCDSAREHPGEEPVGLRRHASVRDKLITRRRVQVERRRAGGAHPRIPGSISAFLVVVFGGKNREVDSQAAVHRAGKQQNEHS